MSDDIEKARAAHAALVAAKAACEAAGLTINASEMRYGDALAQCIERGSAHIDARVRQSVPIAFGDEVTVHHRRETMRAKVVSVGRAIIQTTRGAFRLDTGEQNCDPSNRRIGADDHGLALAELHLGDARAQSGEQGARVPQCAFDLHGIRGGVRR